MDNLGCVNRDSRSTERATEHHDVFRAHAVPLGLNCADDKELGMDETRW